MAGRRGARPANFFKSFDRGAIAPRSNARPPDARGGGAADEAPTPVGAAEKLFIFLIQGGFSNH